MAAKAVIQALTHVWTTLEPLHVPMALMGGLSLAHWRYLRLTHDVDLLLTLEEAQEDTVLKCLEAERFRFKRTPPVMTLGDVRLVQVIDEPSGAFVDIQVDLLLGESEYERQAISRRVAARLPDMNLDIFVLACEDLILHKINAGRLIDKSDAAMLVRLNRDTLDFQYLATWIDRLDLATPWNEIWNEAFPDEVSPLR